jgi:hypothetical protein
MEDSDEPLFPDGMGMRIEDVKRLLENKNNNAVSNDDPILMVVTILNAFLGELDGLHRAHHLAVSRIMSEQSERYLSGVRETSAEYMEDVRKTTGNLGEILKDASISAIRSIFEQHTYTLQTHRNNTMWCAFLIFASAAANIIAYILK